MCIYHDGIYLLSELNNVLTLYQQYVCMDTYLIQPISHSSLEIIEYIPVLVYHIVTFFE